MLRLLRLWPALGVSAFCNRSHCISLVRADRAPPSSWWARRGVSSMPPHDSGVAAASAGGGWDALLQGNQFTTGGLTLMAVGAAAALARRLGQLAVVYVQRRVLVTAEIDSRDDAYRWVMSWLSQHDQFRNSRAVSVVSSMQAFGTTWDANEGGEEGAEPDVLFLPAPGEHLLRFRGQWVWVSRQRTGGKQQLAANARLLVETLVLTMWSASRAPLEALLREARDAYRRAQRARTVVFSVEEGGFWRQIGSRPIRPLRTVVLPDNQAQVVLADCRDFLEAEEWYSHHGIPFRRGYLLHGPPGTGKTSLVMALAGALGLNIYVITLSTPNLSDEMLRNLLSSAAPRSILLLEDVDAAFVGRQQVTGDGGGGGGGAMRSQLSFSGLLNAIDGVAAQEGRLLFLTTNHPDRLAPALVRPGRVDVKVHLGYARRSQAQELFASFYSDLPHLPALMARAGGVPAAAAAAPAAEAASSGDAAQGAANDAGATGAGAAAPAAPAGAAAAHARAAADVAGGRAEPSLKSPADTAALTDGGAGVGAPAPPASSIAAAQRDDDAPAAAASSGGGAPIASGSPPAPPPPAPVPPPNAAERERMLRALEALGARFAAQLPDSAVSMAALQGYLMLHKSDPWAAVAGAEAWARQHQECSSPRAREAVEAERP